jgi:exosortase H (IPTLxxWG-CTERM-specific)
LNSVSGLESDGRENQIVAFASKKGRLTGWNGDALRFVFIFCGYLLVSAAVYMGLRSTAAFEPFLHTNAVLTSQILNLFGAGTEAHGSLITGNDFSFRLIPECTSMIFTAMFASAVLAFPSERGAKLTGMVMGAAALFLINLVRIISLFYIGSAFPSFLEVAHLFLWQILMILAALGLWLFWAERIAGRPRQEEQ